MSLKCSVRCMHLISHLSNQIIAICKFRNNKTMITSLLCAVCFLLGLPCLSECGQYVLDLMDTYGAGMSVIIIAMFELVAIMWGYGVRNFCLDLKAMLGFSPSWYFKVV